MPALTLTPVPTAPPLERTLSLQSPRLQGDDVLLMQQRLAELGYTEVGEPDSIFGQMTENAMIRFQTDQGLTADGIVGLLTWAALWGAKASTPVAAGPMPTSEYSISRTLKLPYPPVGLAFDGQSLWASCGQGDQICGYNPVTGGYIETKPVGVCGYSCSLLYLYYTDQRFLAVQYADLGEINPLTPSGYYLVSDQDQPYYKLSDNVEGAVSFTGEGGRIWVGTLENILVLDSEAESEAYVPPVVKTIYPGISALALLYADGLIWVGGEALLAIDPETYKIVATYPFAADSLAFDGERIWGASSGEQWVRAFDPATQQISAPVTLPGQPIALAFDGQNLWVALWENPELLAIPIE
jgi:peptidoglycan hydrolase-like protein with peptidoglycan-binding domain